MLLPESATAAAALLFVIHPLREVGISITCKTVLFLFKTSVVISVRGKDERRGEEKKTVFRRCIRFVREKNKQKLHERR